MTHDHDKVARAICRESCAFYGDPPCWLGNQEWPNEGCDSPGCQALAAAATAAMDEEKAK